MKFTNSNQILSLLNQEMVETLKEFDSCSFGKDNEHRQNVRKWLIKKADTHPKLVWKSLKKIAAEPEIKNLIETSGISLLSLDAAALLHDLGRLREVNIETAAIELFQDRTDFTHGQVSYDILIQHGCDDPFILLPIKYHDQYIFENGLSKDEMFLNLDVQNQTKVKIIWNLLIDSDRLGNMAYQSIHGAAGTVETLSPEYCSQAVINPDMKRMTLAGYVFPRQDRAYEKTHADVLVRFMAGYNMLRFDASKRVFQNEYLPGIYKHLVQELQTAPGNDENRAQALKDAAEIYQFFNR